MASANVTVTAKTGPASTVTSKAYNNAKSLAFDFAKQTATIVDDGGVVKTFDLYDVATITYTVASHVGTVALS